MKQHKLTVVMTAYNIAPQLPRFFECMRKQTFSDYCLLVVDDGSADDSLAVCREHAAKDDRIKVVASEHLGIPAIKNLALSYLDTPLTAFADGDDYFEPDYLKHLVDALERNNADLAISRVVYHHENDPKPFLTQAAYGETVVTEPEFTEKFPMLLRDRRFNYVYAKAYRTELLKDVHIDDEMIQGEDTVMVLRYMKNVKSIVLIDDEDYHYVKYTSRSVTSYKGMDSYKRMIILNKFLYTYFREQGWLTEEMLFVIDGRMLISGNWAVENIIKATAPKKEKIACLNDIFNNEYYKRAYERQKDNLDKLTFRYIPPQDGIEYYNKRISEEKHEKMHAALREKAPSFIIKSYDKLRGNN